MFYYILQLSCRNLRLLFETNFIFIFCCRTLSLDFLGSLKLFLFYLFFLEIVLKFETIFVTSEVQIVNCHEYFTQG